MHTHTVGGLSTPQSWQHHPSNPEFCLSPCCILPCPSHSSTLLRVGPLHCGIAVWGRPYYNLRPQSWDPYMHKNVYFMSSVRQCPTQKTSLNRLRSEVSHFKTIEFSCQKSNGKSVSSQHDETTVQINIKENKNRKRHLDMIRLTG